MNKREMIKKYRKEIDKIHEKLILFIAQRNKISNKIQKLKKELGLPRIDLLREKEIMQNTKEFASKLRINEDMVLKIIRQLIRKNLER